MKNLLLVLTFIPLLAGAQLQQPTSLTPSNGYLQLQQAESRVAVAEYSIQPVANKLFARETEVKQLVKDKFAELQDPNTDIQQVFSTTSKIGTHYSFQQTYLGIPIHKATCNITFSQSGAILSSYNLLVSTADWESDGFDVQQSLGKPMWIVSGLYPIAAYKKVTGRVIQITDAQGNYIATKAGAYYYEDTLVAGKVFLPDPLTSQQVIYGKDGTYQHFNDSDYALLNDQRKNVLFPATYYADSGFFKLENQYAKMVDLQYPNIAPVTSAIPVFDYTRSQDGFKQVMAMYHIYNTQMYYQYLGFDELKNYQIKVDASSSTSDNSSFNFPSDSSLNFGTGGVPDAEDGDVPSHEYTHALSWFLNPTESMNNERRAIEEATCDMIAANLSKRSTEFNWRLMYNFDAPNPIASGLTKFWQGRNGNSSKTYDNYVNSPYADAEIWLSTMLDIAEAVGNDTAAILMLHSVYSMPENCTMPQAAILYMQADSILFNKSFAWKIGPIFNARKMGHFEVGLTEQARLLKQLTMKNSAGFAQGQGDLTIDLSFPVMYTITDIQGRTIAQQKNSTNIRLSPADFAPGMYIITIQSGSGKVSMKFVR
jgi:hypothetical protein